MTYGITDTPRFEKYQTDLAQKKFTETERENYRLECNTMSKEALSETFNALTAKAADTTENAYERTLASEKSKIAKSVLALKN